MTKAKRKIERRARRHPADVEAYNPFPVLTMLANEMKQQAKATMVEELWNWVSAKKGRRIVIEWARDGENEDSVEIRTETDDE